MSTPAPRLVVGDDGSADADVVWQWVSSHDWPGWRISVVTAQPPPVGPAVPQERASLHPWDPTVPRVLPPGAAAEVEFLTAEADPRVVLDSCHDAALVAVGPRGRGLLARLRIGSTTEWLLSAHRPLRPVVVVRTPQRTESVVLCVDGSPHAREAATALASMPWVGGCRVTVLGVDDGRPDEVRAGLEEAAAALETTGADVVTELRHAGGHRGAFGTRGVILELVEATSPDLVALGTKGLAAVPRLILGSTASAVVNHTTCSVLVAQHHDAEAPPPR